MYSYDVSLCIIKRESGLTVKYFLSQKERIFQPNMMLETFSVTQNAFLHSKGHYMEKDIKLGPI